MKKIPNEITTKIRSLRGSPITILLVLHILGGIAQNKDLESITGYTDKTISRSLDALAAADLVARSAGHWVLINGGIQLILGTPWGRVGNSPTLSPTTTIDFNKLIDIKFNSSSSAPDRKKSDSPPPDLDPEVIQLLASCGIGDPVRSELAALQWVDLSYLRPLIDQWQQDPNPRRRSPGLLITQIRNHDQAAAARQACPECGSTAAMWQGVCYACQGDPNAN